MPIKNNQKLNFKHIKEKKNRDRTIFIPINSEKIKELAFIISQQPMTINETNWFIGENEAIVKNAVISNENLFDGQLPNTIQINPELLSEKPSTEDVRRLAEKSAKKNLSIQESHWELALRKYIVESIGNLNSKFKDSLDSNIIH